MPDFAWSNAYEDAIRETDSIRQILLAGAALDECSRRLLQADLPTHYGERELLRTALADLKLMLYLNRKYGKQH
jgi:hypothetical protein